MFKGEIIKESLKDEAVLDGLHITTTRVVTINNPADGQANVWTICSFEVADEQVGEVAQRLSKSFAEGKWFIDMNKDAQEYYVIFDRRVFNYSVGDTAGREAARAHALSIGVPESQLGWEK